MRCMWKRTQLAFFVDVEVCRSLHSWIKDCSGTMSMNLSVIQKHRSLPDSADFSSLSSLASTCSASFSEDLGNSFGLANKRQTRGCKTELFLTSSMAWHKHPCFPESTKILFSSLVYWEEFLGFLERLFLAIHKKKRSWCYAYMPWVFIYYLISRKRNNSHVREDRGKNGSRSRD